MTLGAEAEASGDLSSIAYVRLHLPQIGLWRGDLAEARQLAAEHLAVAESAGLAAQIASARLVVGRSLVRCTSVLFDFVDVVQDEVES